MLKAFICGYLIFAASFSVQAQTNIPAPPPTQPALVRMIRVQAQILRALIQKGPLPLYPAQAITSGNQGDVILKIDVDESGKVIFVAPVVGDPILVAASIEALRDFRFQPYLIGGMPVRVESQIGFHFSLKHNGTSSVELLADIPFRPEFKTGVVNADGVVVLFPVRISGQDPHLPPSLEGKPGSVYLTITVAPDGKVQDVRVIAGDAAFIEPVVNAVKEYVYEPRLLNGKPTVSTIQASYHFGAR
jgi:TonB family protein